MKAQNAARQAAKAAAKASFLAEHKIVSGDTLSGIAKKYYGEAGKYMTIYNANKAVIGDDPNMIRVGQVLKILHLDA